jgi:hypothetical protein
MHRRNTRRDHWELSRILYHSLLQKPVLTGTIDSIINLCGIECPPGRVAKFLQWAEAIPSVPFIVRRKLVRISKYPQVFYTIHLKDGRASRPDF